MSEARATYDTHPDEIAVLQAAGAKWATGDTVSLPPAHLVQIPMLAACSPDTLHLRREVEALRDLILGGLLVFTPGNVADCLDHILREIDGQGWRIRQIDEVEA